jgi:hypothetical protein
MPADQMLFGVAPMDVIWRIIIYFAIAKRNKAVAKYATYS